MKLTGAVSPLILALGTSFSAASMAQQEVFPLAGVKIPAKVQSSHTPGVLRDVTVDCGTLVEARNEKGRVLGLTVAFVSKFDMTNSPEYMATLDSISRRIIETAGNNLTTNPVQVRYMIGHVKDAHGVQMSDIKQGYDACAARWAPK